MQIPTEKALRFTRGDGYTRRGDGYSDKGRKGAGWRRFHSRLFLSRRSGYLIAQPIVDLEVYINNAALNNYHAREDNE